MKAWSNLFAVTFLIGFTALAAALGYGALAGDFWGSQAFVVALRFFGTTWILVGLTLWIAYNRREAGNEELNPALELPTLAAAILALITALFYVSPLMPILGWASVGLASMALLIGVIVTLALPAFPEPVTVSWPEGGEPTVSGHDDHGHSADHAHEVVAQSADDLTRIEGIGPKLASILKDAGVLTFAQLAERQSDELTKLVKAAGFGAPFNAESWPEQAQLAAAGQWDDLQDLQDQLQGGRYTT
ncbi:MAG: DUF4332 domain-containing protein [Chloroflexi bacterium]|nr:DUF4332 domain-containing protein [Chloroflexota bacterium]